MREAFDDLHAQRQVIEVKDENQRLSAIAKGTAKARRIRLLSRQQIESASRSTRSFIALQQEGKVSREDRQMSVLVNRQDITGAERTFANSYVPDEDIIGYNRASKVYGVNVGDYARVISTDHANNTLTVKMEDGRELTCNPSRLSGVSVYKESARDFAEGDRIQFRAPFVDK